MSAARFIVTTLALSFVYVGIFSILPVKPEPQPAKATQPAFDHSNCQYPDRWSNPANGCDNSDPAVPECIKAFITKEGEEACIAEFVKANDPNAPAPVFPEPTPAPVSKSEHHCQEGK